jgi:hypothetical protein
MRNQWRLGEIGENDTVPAMQQLQNSKGQFPRLWVEAECPAEETIGNIVALPAGMYRSDNHISWEKTLY